jgi:hypothetical protein
VDWWKLTSTFPAGGGGLAGRVPSGAPTLYPRLYPTRCMEVVVGDGAFADRSRQVSPPDDRAMDPPGGPPMMGQSGAMVPPPGGPSPRVPGGPPMPGPPGGRPGGPPPGGRPGGPPGGRGGRGFGGRRGFGGGRSISNSTEHGTTVQMRGSTPGMPKDGPPPVSPVYVRPKTPEEQASSSEDDSSDDEGATVAIEQSFVAPEDNSMEHVDMRPQQFTEQHIGAAPVDQGGQQVGAGGVGYVSSDDEEPGSEFQQMEQRWLDERRDLKMKLRARDSKLQRAETEMRRAQMEVEELQEAVQLARDRAYAAEAEAEAAKAAPPPNEALMSMIERLQAENRNLRKEMISPTLEDEAEKLMAFSDEMDERTEEIKSLRAELDRVNAENARLVEKSRNSSPPHGVAKVTAVKVMAPGPAQQDDMSGPPADAAHAEVMNLRKQCNRLRFQLSEANQKIVKLQEQLLAGGGTSAAVEDVHDTDMPRRDAWSSFGAARNRPEQPDPFKRPAPLEPDRDHDGSEMDTDSESLSASPMLLGGPRDVPDGDREEGMMGGPRNGNSQLTRFESAGRMAVGSREGVPVEPKPEMFEACGRNGADVYLIKRCSIKYEERTRGALECYTVTVKSTGDFVMIGVRETGLTDVVSSSAPLRLFCEDVLAACRNGISPDGSQPSYMGKLVPKSESRGKEFNLFRCKPHRVGLDKKGEEDLLASQELQAWIKVKWKSVLNVPEPRRIKVQLHGDSTTTRMLRNFCAEKRCVVLCATPPCLYPDFAEWSTDATIYHSLNHAILTCRPWFDLLEQNDDDEACYV